MAFEGKVQFNIELMNKAASTLGAAAVDIPVGGVVSPRMPSPYEAQARGGADETNTKTAGVSSVLADMAVVVGKRAAYAKDGRIWASTAATEGIALKRREQGRQLADGWGRMDDDERRAALEKASKDPDFAAGFAREVGIDTLGETAKSEPTLVGKVVGAATRPSGTGGRGEFTSKELQELFENLRAGWEADPITFAGVGGAPLPSSNHRDYDLAAFYKGLSSGAGLDGRQRVEDGKRPSALTLALVHEASSGYYDGDGSPAAFRHALEQSLTRAARTVHSVLSDGTRGTIDGLSDADLRRALGMLISQSGSEKSGLLDALAAVQLDREQNESAGGSVTTFRDSYMKDFNQVLDGIANATQAWAKRQMELGRAVDASTTNATVAALTTAAAGLIALASGPAGVAAAVLAGAASSLAADDGSLTAAQQSALAAIEASHGDEKYLRRLGDSLRLLNRISATSDEHWQLPAEVRNAFKPGPTVPGQPQQWRLKPGLTAQQANDAMDVLFSMSKD